MFLPFFVFGNDIPYKIRLECVEGIYLLAQNVCVANSLSCQTENNHSQTVTVKQCAWLDNTCVVLADMVV